MSAESLHPVLCTIRASFDRAAPGYDAAAALQREVAGRLAERLDLMRLSPVRILDLGSGTGFAAPLLDTRFPKAERIALDLAPAMLACDRARRPPWRRRLWQELRGTNPAFVCADMHALPVASASVDMVWSNVALQWSADPLRVFQECRRVLRPEGLLLFSTFGPDTLRELRGAFGQADAQRGTQDNTYAHINRFIDMHDLGDALMAVRFAAPVMEMEHIVLTYADLKAMLRDLKSIGAHTVLERDRFGLMGRARWLALQAAYGQFARADGRLPATFEVIYGHAWAGPPRPPKFTPGDGSAANAGETLARWPGR